MTAPPSLANLPPVPPGFLWGTATSSAQVEGALPDADWALFTGSARIRARLRLLGRLIGLDIHPQPYGPAVRHFDATPGDHLRFVREDLDRARALGLNAYRFSVEWSRVQPRPQAPPDGAALAYYQNVARAALERGMTPVVTLNHFTLPQWILTPPRVGALLLLLYPEADRAYRRHKGWLDARTVDHYLAYVRTVVPALVAAGVRIFLTFNEPVGSLIGVGYLAGSFPPGLLGAGRAAQRAYWHVIAAHRRAYAFIKGLPEGAAIQVGLAHAVLQVEPGAGPGGRVAPRDRAAARQFDYFCNLHFLDTLIFGAHDRSLTYRERPEAHAAGVLARSRPAPALDFIGINYFRRVHVTWNGFLALTAAFAGGGFQADLRGRCPPRGLITGQGWEIYPAGLYHQLRRLQARYQAAFAAAGRPLRFCVTENGLSEPADANRAPHLVAHVEHMLAARRDGVDVFGYLYWSLLDNWEWLDHYRPEARFGLFSVNRQAPEFPRCLTEGGIALAYLAAAGGVQGARTRFGSVRGDGGAVTPPLLSPGRLYAGQLTGGAHAQPFELYLSARTDGSLLGLLYYGPPAPGAAGDLWVRLRDLRAECGHLAFAHDPLPGRIGAARYTLTAGPDALRLTGLATVGAMRREVVAEKQPLGFYTVSVPARAGPRAEPRFWDGTRGPAGHPWAPLAITRYQQNTGFSQARQLLDVWVPRACPPAGRPVPPGHPLTLALLPAPALAPDRRPSGTPRTLVFSGHGLLSSTGEPVFERAPDGVGL